MQTCRSRYGSFLLRASASTHAAACLSCVSQAQEEAMLAMALEMSRIEAGRETETAEPKRRAYRRYMYPLVRGH
jgi:hypothetical protein